MNRILESTPLERLTRDLAIVRVLKSQIAPDDEQLFAEFTAIESALCSNMPKARDASDNYVTPGQINNHIRPWVKWWTPHGLMIDWELNRQPSAEALAQFDVMTQLRDSLENMILSSAFAIRDVRRYVSIIIRAEKIIFQELLDGGVILDRKKVADYYEEFGHRMIAYYKPRFSDAEWIDLTDQLLEFINRSGNNAEIR
jgi:hypothetical protein